MLRAQVFGAVVLLKRECCMARVETLNWEGVGRQGRPRAGLLLLCFSSACSPLVHRLFTARCVRALVCAGRVQDEAQGGQARL
eukprot:4237953-Pleurochrysis_carterae.AAC.3